MARKTKKEQKGKGLDMDYQFEIKTHTSKCYKDFIEKEFYIEFSFLNDSKIRASILMNVESFLNEDKINIKFIKLTDTLYSDFYFAGYFNFYDDIELRKALFDFSQNLHSSNEYVRWIEFIDQLKNWFNEHIKGNLIKETEIATNYFQQKEKE